MQDVDWKALLTDIDLDLRKQFVSIAAQLLARRVYGYERLSVVEAGMLPIEIIRCEQLSDDPTKWQVDVAINHGEYSKTYLIEEDGKGHVSFLS